MKKHLPKFIKQPLWYIFKSPQRKAGFSTLWMELSGYVGLLADSLARTVFKPELRPVTICTGLYNRSGNYLNQLLESISRAEFKHLIELSVFDCGSKDTADLEKEIREKWKGRLIFRREEMDFTRTESFNRAVRNAETELVFICDADMSLPTDIVRKINLFTRRGRAWFPVCFYLFESRPKTAADENGFWDHEGKGNFSAMREDFERVGGYDERFRDWGGEDTDLWFRFFEAGIVPIRMRCENLFHNWHSDFAPERSKKWNQKINRK